MIEPVVIKIGSKPDPEIGLPSKRFGLYRVGENGEPEILHGRYDTPGEVVANARDSANQFVVEVAHYAFLRLNDFYALFGPLPQAATDSGA